MNSNIKSVWVREANISNLKVTVGFVIGLCVGAITATGFVLLFAQRASNDWVVEQGLAARNLLQASAVQEYRAGHFSHAAGLMDSADKLDQDVLRKPGGFAWGYWFPMDELYSTFGLSSLPSRTSPGAAMLSKCTVLVFYEAAHDEADAERELSDVKALSPKTDRDSCVALGSSILPAHP